MSSIPRINQSYSQIALSNDEVRRYGRHLIMPEVALDGQRKLKAARVLVIGTGGLGSPVLAYLAAAGIGTIGLVDYDTVDASNLHRQIIHKSINVGRPKIQSALETIGEINPYVEVKTYEVAFRSDNAIEIARDYDILIDGTDNFPTRYLVNDVSVLLGKPNVYGSIFRFDGQATVFWAEKGPCYRCLYPEPPDPGMVPTCAEGGVLGVLPGVVGMIQATEAVKLILGQGDPLLGRLLLFDALKMKYRELKVRKDPSCPVCGTNPTITELIDYEQFCGLKAVAEKVLVPSVSVFELDDLRRANAPMDLIDVRDPHEFEIVRLSGSQLIPLGTFTKRMHELDSSRDIYLICKNGQRSEKAWKLLYDAGFRKVRNVEGGLDAWSAEIDPALPTY